MTPTTRVRIAAALSLSTAVALVCAGTLGPTALSAQAAAPVKSPARADAPQGDPIDDLDRVAQVWYRRRLAKSGPERGQEIYYTSCWMCHNEYTIAADPTNAAPSLKDLFKRQTLRSGQPVTDEAVTRVIRTGGSRMPAYPKTMLTDQDVTDLIAALREKCGTYPVTERGGGGCFDEHDPPANPQYRAR